MSQPTGESQPPIIIIKKKSGDHGGHHGGAWKVAYADFVTAMMALFMVLWLLASSEEVQKAVGGYFNDPTGQGKMVGSTKAGAGEALLLKTDDMNKLKEKLDQFMKDMPKFKELKDKITMTVTGEGLRIELLEANASTFFESGSQQPTPLGIETMERLTVELNKLPNRLVIEGHTDAAPFRTKDRGNWELSAERANSVRRLMEDAGMPSGKVAQIRGFADQNLRILDNPTHPSNRRISIIVRYLEETPRPVEQKSAAKPASPLTMKH